MNLYIKINNVLIMHSYDKLFTFVEVTPAKRNPIAKPAAVPPEPHENTICWYGHSQIHIDSLQ